MQAINPIEMVSEAVAMVQKRFYEDYPPHPKEKEYNYKCSSTMKPTQIQARGYSRLSSIADVFHGLSFSLYFRASPAVFRYARLSHSNLLTDLQPSLSLYLSVPPPLPPLHLRPSIK